jgi:hypothetical protein
MINRNTSVTQRSIIEIHYQQKSYISALVIDTNNKYQ